MKRSSAGIAGIQPGLRVQPSMRATLLLGVSCALLPATGVAVWLAWNTPWRWAVVAWGLAWLCVSLALVARAYRPVSSLAARARALAGPSPDPAGVAGIARARLVESEVISLALDRVEQSLAEIAALERVGQMVACEGDLKCILTAIAEEAAALLRADAATIGLWDAGRQVFKDVAACNLPIMFPGREFGSLDSFTSQVASSGEITFLDDYSGYPYRIRELDYLGLRATVGVPLRVGDRCIGALAVLAVDPDRRFTSREGDLLLTFASQAAAGYEKARLYQLALDQLDELTRAREQLASESRELERALSRLVCVQDEERARIAAEVHDGVVQMMVGSLCELQAAMAHFPRDAQLGEAKQKRAAQLIRDSITELRRVIFDLRPITLDTAGLIPAVEGLIGDTRPRSEMRLNLQVTGTARRLTPEAEIGAYRIIQEALNNAVKHSSATCVEISARFADSSLQVAVRDDGQGFSVEAADANGARHAGLIGMRERVRSLGGELVISSTRGSGTYVAATLPAEPRRRAPAHRNVALQKHSEHAPDTGGAEEEEEDAE